MTQPEYNLPKQMSDFSIPYLKDIPKKDRIEVMEDAWVHAVDAEEIDAIAYTEYMWMDCMELFSDKRLSDDEAQYLTYQWSDFVMRIVWVHIRSALLSRGDDPRVCKKIEEISHVVAAWSKEINEETDALRLRNLAHKGITFLEKLSLTPETAKEVLLREVEQDIRKRNGLTIFNEE